MANHAISQSSLPTIPAQPTAADQAQSALPAGFRLVPAAIGRPGSVQTAWVPCPSWCVVDHSERVAFIEDVNHEGEHRGMSLSPSRGDRVPLEVYLSQWPGSEENAQTYLAVDLDYEVSAYGRTAALALADQMVAFAEDVRRLAGTLPDDTVRSQADEALRRVRGGQA
ncbi:hypothetical protein ABZX30_28855 [Streptomyces sp. NPDC004542]|uniref:DUF6907 domain-containing protein n=1 Tax=Streptomyces sp. NPDC004542 TaxID=3154281 RepID=UPI0033A44B74